MEILLPPQSKESLTVRSVTNLMQTPSEKLHKSHVSQSFAKPQVDDESDIASSSIYSKSITSSATNLYQKKRGHVFNEVSGKFEKVIRKRKRKTTTQLEELINAFETDPHWTKEMLAEIASKTTLSEAQVYKWGWDQKRKKYGIAEAERMR